MRIRTRLQVVTAIAATMVIVMALLLYWSQQRLDTAIRASDQAAEIVSNIFERSMLRNDYLRNDSQRAKNQWFSKQSQINALIRQASAQFDTAVGRKIVSNMLKDNEESDIVFQQLVVNRESAGNGRHQQAQTREIENRLVGQLLLKTYDTITDARRLQEVSSAQIASTQKVAALVSLFLIVALAFFVIIVAWSLGRIIGKGIATLQRGAAAIGAGNLQHTIPVAGKNELAEVAGAFNTMSGKLAESHTALEQEIDARKLDAAEIVQLNRELQQKVLSAEQANHALRELNREMEAFTYSVSHDLRAPLRHMTGFVELLMRRDMGSLDEKSRHYLDVISEASVKMGQLIDDLLSFSRMGRGELMKTSIDLNQLTRDAIAEISGDLSLGRTIDWRVGDLPTVSGDPSMLRLVMVNLISNAAKFTGRVASPLVEVAALPPENGVHTIFVRDNGAGFDMKYVDKLFGLFQRLHSTQEYEGTGVGLANVRRIIGRHGGSTWAEGELEKGATFYFTLPHEIRSMP